MFYDSTHSSDEVEHFLRGELPSFLSFDQLSRLHLHYCMQPIDFQEHVRSPYSEIVNHLVNVLPFRIEPRTQSLRFEHLIYYWIIKNRENLSIAFNLSVLFMETMRVYNPHVDQREFATLAAEKAYTVLVGHWLRQAPQIGLISYFELAEFLIEFRQVMRWVDSAHVCLQSSEDVLRISQQYQRNDFLISPMITPAMLDTCGYSSASLGYRGDIYYFINSANHPILPGYHPYVRKVSSTFFGIDVRYAPPVLETERMQSDWVNLGNTGQRRPVELSAKTYFPHFDIPKKRVCRILEDYIIERRPMRST